ncbi:hypothetical protein BGX28_006412 [Mortierella sp. GBA30]|nr:hypothetical protein BGX28_006412 [Mortierella sp. GBA30]
MATASEKYQEQSSLPFTSEELGAFHRFHSYKWDDDSEFQAGLRTITQAQSSSPSFSELLKMKQYYFSTRLEVKINLDDYLLWRRHLERPSDDPNVPIFKRFDEYNFESDIRFQQGLPSIIGQLVKEGKSTLDKTALQKEMTKAKAFYYARFIELFDFPAYLAWKEMEKSQAGPACPYAHLWQNKGKGPGNDLAEDSNKFLTTTSPVSTGALQLHLHSPTTRNVLTGLRLAKLSQAILEAGDQNAITSVFLTVNTGTSSQDHRDPESEIVTKDEKWFSGGVIDRASGTPADKQDPAKYKELLRQYYTLTNQVFTLTNEQQKPVVIVVDGIVSLSAAYVAFGSGAQRVITENAALSFTPLETVEPTPHMVENPFAGLYLLARIQSNARIDTNARPLPKGAGHYLAFCPDYILRGPDLRKLGLADFFVSSSKKKDIEEAVLSVAGCPPPHTTQAIRMALNAEVVYPGPAKIDVWSPEIQECFGNAQSVEEIVSNLEKHDNNWSKSVRKYIASLDPLFAKLLFKAINVASQSCSFQDCVRLEYNLTQKYKEYLCSSQDDGNKATESITNLDSFFEGSEADETALLDFDFVHWLQNHGEEEGNLSEIAHAHNELETQKDPNQACPYLAGKMSDKSSSTPPSDHPNIPGVDFSDPAAAKACPFLSAKSTQKEAETSLETFPSGRPEIPDLDVTDINAAKKCPFLAAKRKDEAPLSGSNTPPADHPVIPGIDFSSPDAVKACPFLSKKAQEDAT